MTLLLDDREKGLLPLFKPYGDVPVQLTRLEIEVDGELHTLGDAAWWGRCEDGAGNAVEAPIGVERKRIGDLVQSMRTGRLSGHQLNGLCTHYRFVFLIVEGGYRAGEGGVLEVRQRKGQWKPYAHGGKYMLFREVDSYLMTLQLRAGTRAGERLIVMHTEDERHTVAHLVTMYKWFTGKSWSQHNAHEEIYAPYDPYKEHKGHRPVYMRRTVGLAEKMIAQIPGLDKGAYAAAEQFRPVFVRRKDGARADADDWSQVQVEVDGKRGKRKQKLGVKRATKIVRALEGA